MPKPLSKANSKYQEDVAISVRGVYKDFKLPHDKVDSVKSLFVNPFNKKRNTYELQHALKDISFEVKKGEFFGIVGRNGSGKSTLLKIIAGIYQPNRGEISVNGRLVPFIELGVGFNPELTGKENVYLNGALMGYSSKEIDNKYVDIVDFAELEKFMDQKLKNYSSGMQVRLAFSVATVLAKSDILLIDEVLAVGDADFQRKCFAYFKTVKKMKKTVVFVTHDMDAVREYCDRAILIQDNKIVKNGKPSDVASAYQALFNKSDSGTPKNAKRWGDGKAKIQKADISITKDQISIDFTVKAGKASVKDLVLGYRIVDTEGKVVAGGSTLNAKNAEVFSLKSSEVKHVKFQLPNVIGNGTFSVGATIRLTDRVTICDYWDEIKIINHSRSEAYYPIVLPATLEIV